MTPIVQYRPSAECSIHVAALTEADTVEQMLHELDYAVDLSQMKAESRRREYVGIRLLLRRVLGAGERIVYEGDIPRLASGRGYISIAHSHGVLAIALHRSRPLGMDLELFGRKMQRVRSVFLTPAELAWQADDDGQFTLAHLCWTAKEALFKLIGQPVYDFASQIELSPITRLPQGRTTALAAGRPYQIHYWTTTAYALSLVIEEE